MTVNPSKTTVNLDPYWDRSFTLLLRLDLISCSLYQELPVKQTIQLNDYNALLRVCQYLKQTMKLIFFKVQNLILKGYSDSDHAEDKETRKSTTGSIWTICSTPVSWFSKR